LDKIKISSGKFKILKKIEIYSILVISRVSEIVLPNYFGRLTIVF
jgi:hypothetical protein